MLKVGDKVRFIQINKFQKEFKGQVGVIDIIKPRGKYCIHVKFKNEKINKEAEHLWWEDDNLKLLNISDEEYNSMHYEIEESENYENEIIHIEIDKYGFKYIGYAKTIATVQLVFTLFISFVMFIYALSKEGNGLLTSIFTFLGGIVGYIFLLLFISMAENIAFIRKNGEKDNI
jgi:hypothetical protein